MVTFTEFKSTIEKETNTMAANGTAVAVQDIGGNSLMLHNPANLQKMRLDLLPNNTFIREFKGQRSVIPIGQPLAATVVDDILIPLLR